MDSEGVAHPFYSDDNVAGPSWATMPRQFTTSSCRDEPYVEPPPPPPPPPPPTPLRILRIPESSTDSSTVKVRYVREVQPGVLEDGRWLPEHPFVERYIDALLADYERKTKAAGGGPSSTLQFQMTHGNPSVGRPEDVGDLIGEELSLERCEVVFTLTAVRTMLWPHHPAHFAIWNVKVGKRTAETVERTWRAKRQLLYHPDFVWMDIRTDLYRCYAYHNFDVNRCYDESPKPDRTRPATRAAAARNGGDEQAAGAPRTDKGKAVDRGEPERATAPRPPRPKTTRTRPSASTEPAAPTRRSQRRAATTKKSALQTSTTAEEAASLEAKVEQIATPALATPVPEPNPNGTEADVDVETTEQQAAPVPVPATAPTPTAKRARATRAAPSRVSKRVAARTSDPAPVPAATASPTPVPTPQAQGSATPEAALLVESLQPSRSSTAVGSSEEPDKLVVVEEEPVKVAGKKRKADDLVQEHGQEAAEEDGPRRKSSRTAKRKLTEKGQALDAEMKAEKSVKRSRTRRR